MPPMCAFCTRVAALAVVVALAIGCGDGHSQAVVRDPPHIVPRQAIGAARLGMTRARVERVYTDAAKVQRSRRWFAAGTRYYGELRDRRTYQRAGRTLSVWHVRDPDTAL